MIALLALSLVGCGIHNPEKVARIAQAAETDPRKIEKLVQALKSDDEATWNQAYASLVELGDRAVDPLERAILERHPASGRAILALGEMVNPDLFPFLGQCLRTPEISIYAQRAFEIAERPFYDRLEEERQIASCDIYLQYFPQGSWRSRVEALKHELQAEDAWVALGRKPKDAEIIAFLRRYGDTPMGEKARTELSGRLLVDASRELGRQRFDQALRYLEQAREIDPDVAADAVEAAVRFAIGNEAVAARRYSDAVSSFQQALSLGAGTDVRRALARAYVERSREGFARSDFLQAMLDLREAEKTDASLTAEVGETRRQQVYELLALLDKAEVPSGGIVEALVLAGPAAQAPLEAALWRRLAVGDASLLQRAIDSGAREPETSQTRAWVTNVVERALSEADGDIQLFFASPSAFSSLMRPGDLLSPMYQGQVENALAVLRRYVTVVEAGHYHTKRIGPLRGPLPAGAPLKEAEVLSMFRQGLDGRDSVSLPPITRAQLLEYQLTRVAAFRMVARDRGGALAAQVLATGVAPFLLGEWVRLVDDATGGGEEAASRVRLPDGTSVGVTGSLTGQDYRITIMTSQAYDTVPDAWVRGALSVLFSLVRPVLATMPAAERFHVVWVAPVPPATEGMEERIRFTLTRHAADRLDWTFLESQRPFGPDLLRLLPDHLVR